MHIVPLKAQDFGVEEDGNRFESSHQALPSHRSPKTTPISCRRPFLYLDNLKRFGRDA
jgi:hypothetical protein